MGRLTGFAVIPMSSLCSTSEGRDGRLLKAHDLITSPAFVVIKAADEFRDKTTATNQLWQTDFTYFKVIGIAPLIAAIQAA